MSNSKVVNELLSQLQTQIKNYKNKLANKSNVVNASNVSNAVNSDVSGDLLIEDGYAYDAPAESEFAVEYSNKETEEDQGSIKEYVLKCACHNTKNEELVDNNTSIVIDGETQKDSNTSVIEEPKVDTVIGNTSEIGSQPKLTEKEKSFFG